MRYYIQVMLVPKTVRYIISGGMAAGTNIGLLFVFVHLCGLHYLIASVIAFFFGLVVSFALQKFWTFADRRITRMLSQLALYIIIALVNLILNTVLVYTFVELFGVWYLLSQALASAIIALYSYFAYQKIIFSS